MLMLELRDTIREIASSNPFPIDLDNVSRWLFYKLRQRLITILTSKFTLGEHYREELWEGEGGEMDADESEVGDMAEECTQNSQKKKYYLSVECFERFCGFRKGTRGRKVHGLFLEAMKIEAMSLMEKMKAEGEGESVEGDKVIPKVEDDMGECCKGVKRSMSEDYEQEESPSKRVKLTAENQLTTGGEMVIKCEVKEESQEVPELIFRANKIEDKKIHNLTNVKEEPDNLSRFAKEIEIEQREIRGLVGIGENSMKCLDGTYGENSKKARGGRESAKTDNFRTGTMALRKKIIECDRAIRQIANNYNTTTTPNNNNNINNMNICRIENINDIFYQQNTQPSQQSSYAQRRHLEELEQRWVQQNAKMQKVLDTIDSLSPLECVYLFEPTTYRVPNIYDNNSNNINDESENEQVVFESNQEIIEDEIESLLNL